MSSSLLRIKRCFQTCDVAELYLLVACRSSTRGQGLTFTSARVLARALFRASSYMTFGTPITSRPLGREVPLRSRAPVSCVTATTRLTVEEMCGLSLWLPYGHRVRALLVLAPPDLGSLLIFCIFPEASRCCFKGGLSSAQGLSSHPPCDTLSLSLSLCLAARASLLPGEGECSTARGPLSQPPSSVSVLCCEQHPSYHRFPVAGAVFLTCPVSPWHDLLSLALSLSSASTTAGDLLLHQHTRDLCLFFSSCGSRFSLLHLDVVY